MALLRKITNEEIRYARIGLYGAQGTGKTTTASEIAIGLSILAKEPRKVAFVDTEGGIDYVSRRFASTGVELLGVKTRSYHDCVDAIREAIAAGCSVIIIDSVTHIWDSLLESYCAERRIDDPKFKDWGIIKKRWRGEFVALFLTSRCHMIACGRSADVYDVGPRSVEKTGEKKMRCEGEFLHEPSLCLLMERSRNEDSGKTVITARVEKDRTDTMQGQVVEMPTFASFRPAIERMTSGATHVVFDATRPGILFGGDDWEADRRKELLEMLKAKIFNMSDDERKLYVQNLFGMPAKEAFSKLELWDLEARIGGIK